MKDKLNDAFNWFLGQDTKNKVLIIIAAALILIIIVFLVLSLVFANSPLTGNALEQYKASCISISYQELSVNVNKYNGQHVKFTGKVVSSNPSNGNTQILMSVTPVNGGWSTTDLIFVTYNAKTQFKAGDVVTVYGDVAGTYNYISVSNGQLIIPKLIARNIELTPILSPAVVGVPFSSSSSNGSNNSSTTGNVSPINNSPSNPTNSNISGGRAI
jgi:hypothetical protein